MSNFSNNLRALRMSNSISQKELAKKLSIDFRALSRLETSVSEPNLEVLEKIADYFTCSVDYLLGREDESGLITIKNEYEKSELEKINEQLDSVHKSILLGYATALLQEQKRLA